MEEGKIKELCDRIRQVAYDIHVYHAQGHLEKVYENALAHRLRKAGIKVDHSTDCSSISGRIDFKCESMPSVLKQWYSLQNLAFLYAVFAFFVANCGKELTAKSAGSTKRGSDR